MDDSELSNLKLAPRKSSPSGVGGWLILPVIGLCITPLLAAHTLATELPPAFKSPMWEAFTQPGGRIYSPAWMPYLAWGVAGNLLLVATCVYLLFLLSRGRKLFPKLIIGLYLFILLSATIDLIMSINVVQAFVPSDGEKATATLGRAILQCCIWIPYFLTSKRVHNTFVD